MARRFLITGLPGVGKTTVLLKTIQILKTEGLRVGGMVCREVRVEGVRIGFKVEDLESGQWGWLANVEFKTPVKVGKYGVNVEDLENVGVRALRRALLDENVPIIALDEIGPMELKSRLFYETVIDIVKSSKLLMAVLHHRIGGPLMDLLNSSSPMMVRVSPTNRDTLPRTIATMVLNTLRA
jgi:nucleoside-triphosphatase